MMARHPLTGKPIRIMNCEGTAWKDAATLVWLDGTEAVTGGPTPTSYNRWDVGVASVEAWRAATLNGVKPDVALLLGDETAAAAWLQAGHWASVRVVAAPRSVLEHIGLDVLNSLKIHNMFCLEEAIQLYPYLGKGWTPDNSASLNSASLKTLEAAKALVAAVLRYSRTFPVAAPPPVPQLKTLTTLEAPPQLILVTQYYRPEKARRGKEIDECLRQNVACPYIDRVVLLNEAPDIPLPVASSKITSTSIGGRLTLQAVIRWIYDEAPAGSLVVFANSDIYLDDTWRTLWSVDMANKFFSLLRWNDDPAGGPATLFGPRPDSQDTWVVAADSVKARTWDWAALDIPFGKGGCDNAFNVEFLRQKFLVVNPALSLKTHHVHASEIRTYDPRDIVDRPMYMYIHPSGLQDFKSERTLPQPAFKVEQPAIAIPCGSVATESQRRTWQTMSVKAAPYLQEGCVTLPVVVPVATAANVFTHAEGLVSTYNSVLLGTTKAAAAAWEEMALSKVTASVDSDLAFVAPCPEAVAASPALYTLRYLAKILVMRGRTGEMGEFMCDPAVANHTLSLFSWPTSTVPVLARTPHFQAFCRRAFIWHPQDGAAAWATAAEVDALRGALRDSWEAAPTRPVRIVCALEDQMIQALEGALPRNVTVDVITSATPFPEVIKAMRGAAAFVFAGSPAVWAAAWALPERATMVELQPEMRASAEAAHFAAVAGLDYALVPMPRGAATQSIVARIIQALGLAKAAPASPMPIRPMDLLMPKREGFFGHAGDSFREMVDLWAERGYVAVERRDDICNVWLSGVGDTLLYDRPTMEWLNRSPIREKGWRRALFGNPAPAAQNAHAWTFWPRRPRLVEALVARGVGGSLKRSKRLVFYGRSENAVQKERRTAADWATAFGPGDVFSHVEGAAPYPLTQEEYLEALADAKFGLCLAGYGYKCHREVECMAMGCVPIVAPEVDMDNYADPPKEGVHYIRAATPKAAVAAMSSLSPTAWAAMSSACRAWWRRNASVEGSWAVTKVVAGF